MSRGPAAQPRRASGTSRRAWTLLRAVWDSALDVDAELARSFGADKPEPASRPHELEELWRTTGFEGVELGQVEAGADYADFDDLWYPFTKGVGNTGRFHEALDEAGRGRSAPRGRAARVTVRSISA